jgi:hypothetical protein
MIKITLDYENGTKPRVILISDSHIIDEKLAVDFINSYLYDYFYNNTEIPEPYQIMVEESELWTNLASTLQNYDVWEGWIPGKGFDARTIVEVI